MKSPKNSSRFSGRAGAATEAIGQRLVGSSAAERNKQPILNVLRDILPDRGLVLEIASGAGQHVVHFARALPALEWLPTEQDPEMRALIAARLRAAELDNVREPLALDASSWPWAVERADAVVCINMIHIAPWSATEGLIAGAGRVLPPGGTLYVYGPFRRFGRHTAPTNEAFDGSLRTRDPRWGVRDLESVAALAEQSGLDPRDVVAMPANNFSVSFVRRAKDFPDC